MEIFSNNISSSKVNSRFFICTLSQSTEHILKNVGNNIAILIVQTHFKLINFTSLKPHKDYFMKLNAEEN